MDVLRELIQTIIVIVVLAVLVEMLLPGGDMRRYIKMVMGLLIIMAVLQAAAGALNSRFMQNVPAVTVSDNGTPPLEDIMATGQELADNDREKAVHQLSEGLSGQVIALAGMNSDIRAVDARVSIDRESSNISEITIVFNAACNAGSGDLQADKGANEDLSIQPVVVNLDGQSAADMSRPVTAVTPEQKKTAAGMAAVVAQFYNLKPDQVKYEFLE